MASLQPAPVIPPLVPFLTNVKPLVFEGTRSGEGYFSKDGKFLTFQSEREPGNPFYQIYLMNLQTRETKRISPGYGKTTCSWIHPSNMKVLFGSTHLDPRFKEKVAQELQERASPIKKKYSWSFDDTFDMFEADTNGRILRRLTKEKGYDAEGSYSPSGEWIAFASNRRGYQPGLTKEEQELFAKDPSSQMDIYIMKSDGSELKRLTEHWGYDGGPFFSPDGTKIIWRRFNQQGTNAEVFTMNLDGSEQTQITRLNAMSWAPFFHPSGDYVIFTTNKIGYSNFELYIVDSKGTKDPVRVSYMDGFDGLPVFSPDGQKVVWAHTNEKGESQLHVADWNDTLARKVLGLGPAKPDIPLLSAEVRAQDINTWVNYLASPEMGGRMSGSPQEAEYTRTLANAFQDFGLVPEAGNDFLQPFEFTSGVELGIENDAKISFDGKRQSMALGKNWMPLSVSKVGIGPAGPLVFAGYGIVAPAGKNQAAYDSYAGLNVNSKWVVVFRGIPDNVGNERRYHLNLYSRLQHKALVARQRGAIGLIVVNDSVTPPPPLTLTFEGRADSAGIPVVMISAEEADAWFKLAKSTREEWTKKLAQGETGSFSWENSKADIRVDFSFKKSQGRNVVGILKAPGAKSTVLIGAHGDHLGHGEMGNSLAKGDEAGKPHVGADDNASGVAAVMELAHSMAAQMRIGAFKPKQNIAFAVWSGEEIGILGSSQFAKAHKNISAYLNMDMIGRLRSELIVQGAGSAKEWRSLIEKVLARTELPLAVQDDPYLPTDAMAFYLQGVPSISFFTGAHSEYHTPRDIPATLNSEGAVRVAQAVGALSQNLANQKVSPIRYQKVEGNSPATGTRSFRLYLGTIPDYSVEGKKGVLISGTSKNSPAEKAGVLPGDVIVEMGGVKIENIYDYVYCLQAMKANEKTPLKVMRKDRVVQLEIVPALKADQ